MQGPGGPLVTVVAPLAATAAGASATVLILQGQTLHRWELLLVGDTEGRSLPPLYDGRARVVPLPPGADWRNAGLAEAQGAYVAFLMPGHHWRPDFLQGAVQWLHDSGHEAGHAAVSLHDATGRVTVMAGHGDLQTLRAGGWIDVGTLVCRTEAARATGGFEPELGSGRRAGVRDPARGPGAAGRLPVRGQRPDGHHPAAPAGHRRGRRRRLAGGDRQGLGQLGRGAGPGRRPGAGPGLGGGPDVQRRGDDRVAVASLLATSSLAGPRDHRRRQRLADGPGPGAHRVVRGRAAGALPPAAGEPELRDRLQPRVRRVDRRARRLPQQRHPLRHRLAARRGRPPPGPDRRGCPAGAALPRRHHPDRGHRVPRRRRPGLPLPDRPALPRRAPDRASCPSTPPPPPPW